MHTDIGIVTNYNLFEYKGSNIIEISGIKYLISGYSELSVIYNSLKGLFGLSSLNTVKMSINGVSYIGYRISGDFFTIREVIINSTMIEDARRIFVFRLITGLTFNEKKIIIRGGRAISWGEVRMRKTRRFVPELIERKWFSDISVSMFANGITEIFDPLFRKRIENVISRINPNLIYLSDTIETNICSFLT